ncbi:MAG: cytochrome b N-terminal domain-containing protein, partial [Pedosphaera parvula]|nr:cytochrome b N-terminal domain-containing protein [Pedosphaera parvula]
MKALFDWLDQRTGCRRVLRRFLFESIPGGSRWRYAWGTALIYAFGVQVITGFFLWTGYSPSGQTAWESVYFTQYEMAGGWLLRGLHHYTAQAFVVLLALHLFQMILFGAYRAPRELSFWLALLLVPLAITISATGWLLPYDQGGFWASRVPINIMGATPVLGPVLQKLAMGGPDFGHHTLTRFFALHAGLMPPLIAAVLALHYFLNHRQGLADPGTPGRAGETWWPDQFLRDALLCAAVLGAMVGLIFLPHWIDPTALPGVELGAPADPSEQYSAARPEWFMLFLFQLLKYFPGGTEIWGAVV